MLKSRLLSTAAALTLAAGTAVGLGAGGAAAAQHAAHRLAPGTVSVPPRELAHLSHLLAAHRPAPAAGSAALTSTNWAGYVANNGSFSTVSSNWTEPSVSCTAAGIVAFWIGIDGYGSSSVEQDGTGVDCSSGSPQAFAWWETYPANSIQEYADPVAAGDALSSTVTDVGGGQYRMVLTDSSAGWSENRTVSASGSDASAEVIAEAVSSGSSVTPLPDFGSIEFTGSTFDGSSIQSAGAQAIDMTGSGGTVIAATGSDDANGDFAVTYGGSSQPPPGGGGGGTGCGGAAAWSAGATYAPGDVVSYNGHKWTSTWYSTGATPGAAASWAVWTDDGAC